MRSFFEKFIFIFFSLVNSFALKEKENFFNLEVEEMWNTPLIKVAMNASLSLLL
jgi:hypothetical protein